MEIIRRCTCITEVITRKKNWGKPQNLRSLPAVNYVQGDTVSRTRIINYTKQVGFQKVIAVNFNSLNSHLPGSTESEPQWTNCNFMCGDWDSQSLLPKGVRCFRSVYSGMWAITFKVIGVKDNWFKFGYKPAPVTLTSCKKRHNFILRRYAN